MRSVIFASIPVRLVAVTWKELASIAVLFVVCVIAVQSFELLLRRYRRRKGG